MQKTNRKNKKTLKNSYPNMQNLREGILHKEGSVTLKNRKI